MKIHVLTTHYRGGDDNTPMHYISGAQLEAYRRIEAEYLKLLQHRGAPLCSCGRNIEPAPEV